MKRTFMTIEVYNVVAYFNQISKEKLTALPTKMRWYIRKNLNRFIPISKEFDDFRVDLAKELQTEYFGEEKSVEEVRDKLGDNGEPLKDVDGNIETETIRRVKPEYIDEYKAKLEEVNKKLEEIASEKQEIEIDEIDLDGFVETMPDDCPITYEDLDILSAFTRDSQERE